MLLVQAFAECDAEQHVSYLGLIISFEREVRFGFGVSHAPCLVHCVRRLLGGGQGVVHFGEVEVGPAHAGDGGGEGGDVNYARGAFGGVRAGGDEFGGDQAGEQEMADVVGCEVHFDVVFAEGARGKVHDGGVVDDYVDGGDVGPVEEFRGGGADGFLGGEVEGQSAVGYGWVGGLEVVDAFLDFGGGAACYDEMGGGLRCKSLCCGETDASKVHSCDQDGPSFDGVGEGFGHVETFRLLIKLGVGGSGHVEAVDVFRLSSPVLETRYPSRGDGQRLWSKKQKLLI